MCLLLIFVYFFAPLNLVFLMQHVLIMPAVVWTLVLYFFW
jgi:hypothetical protein